MLLLLALRRSEEAAKLLEDQARQAHADSRRVEEERARAEQEKFEAQRLAETAQSEKEHLVCSIMWLCVSSVDGLFVTLGS